MAQLIIRCVYTVSLCLIITLHDFSRSTTEAGCVSRESVYTVYKSATENEYICPNPCQCHYLHKLGGLSVICTGKGLIRVPLGLPENTVQLNLDNNKISHLTRLDFRGCFKLRQLLLKLNELSSIDTLTFADTSQLTELHLNNNALNISNSASGFLDHLKNITALSIEGNPYIDETVFGKLPRLYWLSLDRSESVAFGKSFLNLTMLKHVGIHGTFTRIENNSFENLRNANIEVLQVRSRNTLHEIESEAFGNIRHLDKLDLSFNRGIGFDIVSRAWHGLRHKNISALKLTSISPTTVAYTEIKKSFYNYLGEACITSLRLNKNDIISIDYGLADAFPCLENLNLSFNRLSQVNHLIKDLSKMDNLRHADISYTTKRLPDHDRSLLYKPKNLDENFIDEKPLMPQFRQTLSDENLLNCNFTEWVPCNIAFLHKSEDNERRSRESTLEHISDITPYGPWCSVFPRRLESINLTASLNYIIQSYPQTCVLGRQHNLREYVFRSNEVKEFRGPVVLAYFSNSTPLTIDFGDNGAYCISPNFFKISIQRGTNISRLILDGNRLGEQLYLDQNGTIFEDYKDLTELNLAKNNIKDLHASTFKNLKNLRILNLRSNSLRYIPFTISHMRHLEHLDLSHNLLTDLSSDVYLNITRAFASSNLTLSITGNPIQCSYQTLPFLVWLNDNRKHIDKIENIYCLINNTQIYFDRLEADIIKPLTLYCQSDLLLIVCGSLLATVIVAVIASVCLYRHKADITFCLIKHSRNAEMYFSHQPKDYQYDAFVSYDSRDRDWVTQELIPNIEQVDLSAASTSTSGSHNLRLCIHERDFTPGENIHQQIFAKIRSSRKVLLILTRNFLEGHWCIFELEMSQVESFERRYNIIVPIMLNNLPLKDLPGPLQMLIRRQTYIEWKNNLPDRKDFWIRLRSSLTDTNRERCACECQGFPQVLDQRTDAAE